MLSTACHLPSPTPPPHGQWSTKKGDEMSPLPPSTSIAPLSFSVVFPYSIQMELHRRPFLVEQRERCAGGSARTGGDMMSRGYL